GLRLVLWGPGAWRARLWACGAAVTGSGLVRPLAPGGGRQAVPNRFIQSWARCQPWGRCKVISVRPWRAVRAATSMSSRRSVAPRALAQAGLARDPAARSRLWLMAARVSQAALAGNEPDGRWARGPS